MHSLQDMLKSSKPIEPPQVRALKKYAKDTYDTNIQVVVNKNFYLVRVVDASLAHRFRMDTASITELCQLDKRLVIHIGF